MLVFRQKSFQFCIPRLKTQQTILPLYIHWLDFIAYKNKIIRFTFGLLALFSTMFSSYRAVINKNGVCLLWIMYDYRIVYENLHEFRHRFFAAKWWYFVSKIVLTYYEKKNCSSDREKTFEIRGWRLRILRSLEQYIQTVKGQNNFWYYRMLF